MEAVITEFTKERAMKPTIYLPSELARLLIPIQQTTCCFKVSRPPIEAIR